MSTFDEKNGGDRYCPIKGTASLYFFTSVVLIKNVMCPMIYLGLYLHMALEFVETFRFKIGLRFSLKLAEFIFCPQSVLYDFQELAS